MPTALTEDELPETLWVRLLRVSLAFSLLAVRDAKARTFPAIQNTNSWEIWTQIHNFTNPNDSERAYQSADDANKVENNKELLIIESDGDSIVLKPTFATPFKSSEDLIALILRWMPKTVLWRPITIPLIVSSDTKEYSSSIKLLFGKNTRIQSLARHKSIVTGLLVLSWVSS